MPKAVVETFLHERNDWLMRHGIDSKLTDWKSRLAQLGRQIEQEFFQHFSDRWNDELDNCHGACVLRDPNCAEIVANSLQHFDCDRYELTDFVVMPNHVHVLVAFPDEDSLLTQCESFDTYINSRHEPFADPAFRVVGCFGRIYMLFGFFKQLLECQLVVTGGGSDFLKRRQRFVATMVQCNGKDSQILGRLR